MTFVTRSDTLGWLAGCLAGLPLATLSMKVPTPKNQIRFLSLSGKLVELFRQRIALQAEVAASINSRRSWLEARKPTSCPALSL